MERGWGLPFRTWGQGGAGRVHWSRVNSQRHRPVGVSTLSTTQTFPCSHLPCFWTRTALLGNPQALAPKAGAWSGGVSVPQSLGVSLSPSPCPRTRGRCLEELLREGAQGRCLWPLDIHWPSRQGQ